MQRARYCGECRTTFPEHIAHGHLSGGAVVTRQVRGPQAQPVGVAA